MELTRAFGIALREVRTYRGLTQEDFSDVSSRTDLSSLERGIKGPTIEKVNQLAEVLQFHPLSILLAAYLKMDGASDRSALLRQLSQELEMLGL